MTQFHACSIAVALALFLAPSAAWSEEAAPVGAIPATAAKPAKAIDAVPASLRTDAQGGPLDQDETTRLVDGDVLTALIEVENNPVKKGVAVGIVDAPPAKVFATIGDYPNFKDFMPYVDKTTVDEKDGNTTTVSYVLKFPMGLGGRNYQLKLTDGKAAIDGVDVYTCEWVYTGKGNITDTTGTWQVAPWGDGSKSFVRYTVFTDPGGSFPNWIKNKAASMALPSVIKAVRDRVKSDKAAPPVPY